MADFLPFSGIEQVFYSLPDPPKALKDFERKMPLKCANLVITDFNSSKSIWNESKNIKNFIKSYAQSEQLSEKCQAHLSSLPIFV